MPLGIVVIIAVFAGIFIHANSEVNKERREKIRGWARLFKKYVNGEGSEAVDYFVISTMIEGMERYVSQSKKDFHERVRTWARSMRTYLSKNEQGEDDKRMALDMVEAMERYADAI